MIPYPTNQKPLQIFTPIVNKFKLYNITDDEWCNEPVALFFWVRAISASISLIFSTIPIFPPNCSCHSPHLTKRFKSQLPQVPYLLPQETKRSKMSFWNWDNLQCYNNPQRNQTQSNNRLLPKFYLFWLWPRRRFWH